MTQWSWLFLDAGDGVAAGASADTVRQAPAGIEASSRLSWLSSDTCCDG